MFYYLLYNSSFSFIVESRLFSTILYGSILYILSHAVLNYCDVSILSIINNYYWTLFTLDIISFFYSLYQSITNINNTNIDGQNDLNVSFNILKNKVNTILDRKNDLTITQSTVQNKQNNSNANYKQQSSIRIPQISSNKFSTPITQLQNMKKNSNNTNNTNNTNNKSSTPISIIRNNINIEEPYIDDQDESQNNQYGESVAGSDVGNVMDLSDFETTL